MKSLGIVFFVAMLLCASAAAQTTAFTYQSSLKDGASPANGNYDLEFRLFNLASGGSQLSSTIQRLNVAVANGIFTVSLDFGAAVLSGTDRFLNIAVRTAGGGAFTALVPRQQLTSAPYAIRSLNSTSADTVVTLPTGSGNYIQNGVVVQTQTNFNISGTGTANILSAGTQYNLGGNRVLGSPGVNNLFAGVGAGQDNTTGSSNSFFGQQAGESNTSGSSNSFYGSRAGTSTTTGEFNSFFGNSAGFSNTTGSRNTFFGSFVGQLNTNANDNAFFGASAGQAATGSGNAFFGSMAGSSNNTGSSNAFFGQGAGDSNTTGSNNTAIGRDANLGSGALNFATAIGSGSIVPANNMVRLGRNSDTVSAPGTLIVGNSLVQRGNVNFYSNAGNMDLYLQAFGASTGVNIGVNSGPNLFISHYDGTTYEDRIVITPTGTVRILTLGTAGATQLCRNATNELATCSSSLKYKENIGNFSEGLSFINKLRPISFDWKDGGMKDVGFGAEDIAKIDPRFVTYNSAGEVEGVKYDRLSVAFVNAFKEQQKTIESQQMQIDALKKLVCLSNKDAEICKEK